MKKILSMLLVAVMIFSVLSLTVAADTTYSIATDGDGNALNPYFVNNDVWVEENGGVKMPAGKLFSFLLFDTPLTTNRVEAKFENLTLSGSGDDRNGIAFAVTDHDGDATLANEGDAGVSYYWACISGWEGRICVLKMGKYNGWEMISEGGWGKCGTPLAELGIDPVAGVTLAVEWDNEGHIKVFANGKLVEDITDTTGTPLTGNLYGLVTRRWANRADSENPEAYTDTVTSFVAGVASKPETGDTTVIVSLIALVAAMGTGIVIGKKRSFN